MHVWIHVCVCGWHTCIGLKKDLFSWGVKIVNFRCIAGKFGGELNLAFWWSMLQLIQSFSRSLQTLSLFCQMRHQPLSASLQWTTSLQITIHLSLSVLTAYLEVIVFILLSWMTNVSVFCIGVGKYWRSHMWENYKLSWLPVSYYTFHGYLFFASILHS